MAYTLFPTVNDVATVAGNGKKLKEQNLAKWLDSMSGQYFVVSGGAFPGVIGSLTLPIPAIKVVIKGYTLDIDSVTNVLCVANKTNKIWIQLPFDLSNNATGYIFAAVDDGSIPADAVYIGTAITDGSTITSSFDNDKNTSPIHSAPNIMYDNTRELLGKNYKNIPRNFLGASAPYTEVYHTDGAIIPVGNYIYFIGGTAALAYNTFIDKYDTVNSLWVNNDTRQTGVAPKNTITGVVGDYIYLLLGYTYVGSQSLKCYKYNYVTKVWTNLADSTQGYMYTQWSSDVLSSNIYAYDGATFKRYNTGADNFTLLAVPGTALYLTKLLNVAGVLYGFGGYTGAVDTNRIIQYNIADSWADTAATLPFSSQKCLGAVYDGKAYIKQNNGPGFCVFDPVAITCTSLQNAPTQGDSLICVGTKLYLINTSKKTICVYDLLLDTWSVPTPPTALQYPALAIIQTGKVYSLGGYTSAVASANNQSYDTTLNKWLPETNLLSARTNAKAIIVGNYLYLFGGANNPTGTVIATNDRYDLAAKTWANKLNMPTARRDMVVLEYNGTIFVMGGYTTSLYSKKNEGYLISGNSWTPYADIPGQLFHFGCKYNNKFYLWSYTDAATSYQIIFEYDPVNDSWCEWLNLGDDFYFGSSGNPIGMEIIDNRLFLFYNKRTSISGVACNVLMISILDMSTKEITLLSPTVGLREKARTCSINGRIYYIGKGESWPYTASNDSGDPEAHRILCVYENILTLTTTTYLSFRRNVNVKKLINITTNLKGDTVTGLTGDSIGVVIEKWLPQSFSATVIGG